MKKHLKFTTLPKIGYDDQTLEQEVRHRLKLHPNHPLAVRILKRSVDARGRQVKVHLELEAWLNETPAKRIDYERNYPDVKNAPRVLVIGAGPAGMFAALRLVELGAKPILIERGKDVKRRTKDIADISRRHIVHEDSNYCFGEGGAGTFSDGKLYTRSKKRGDWRRILEIFVAHGANENILYESHPHIGTNKLPRIIREMRTSILEAGGEVHFDTKVSDFILKNGEIKGVITQKGDKIEAEACLLATGHSARDIFKKLHEQNIFIELKPFALGVRAEHAQSMVDQIQYHCDERGLLPAASYALVTQVPYRGKKRGVFSFCMCPGGFAVPSATTAGEVVVNGMSPSRRNSKYANSGIVVSVEEEDLQDYAHHGPLAAMYFQEAIERHACLLAGGTQAAPAQRLVDFVQSKTSSSLPSTSYQPGTTSVDLSEVLPPFVASRLKGAFKAFGKKMKGYYSNEAILLGVESRTSSPVRIPRDRESYEHPQISRLYPCGEGAGYAGGIASAAMDGERCAEKIFEKYIRKH